MNEKLRSDLHDIFTKGELSDLQRKQVDAIILLLNEAMPKRLTDTEINEMILEWMDDVSTATELAVKLNKRLFGE